MILAERKSMVRARTMAMKSPIFSIIVTTHERAELLERAILSITEQEFEQSEIIVISDEKSQETACVCSRLLRPQDIFVARNGKAGPAQSRNLALKLATGGYCIFLDDDDRLAPGLLHKISTVICGSEPIMYVWNYGIIDEDRSIVPIPEPSNPKIIDIVGRNKQDLMIANYIPNNCFAVAMSIAKNLTFDESLRSAEDWDFNIAVLATGCRFEPINTVGSYVHHDISSKKQRNVESLGQWGPDFFYIYRRWPARTADQKASRQEMLSRLHFSVDEHWL